ncbi:glycosyltransferase family 39 protein [Aliirhizobium terrae]|uniref:ArnT family glycosyltransferase n=1 Tax=Terrirhizobium terrae TaxID=2926709 RepID=UPI0025784493|nr:glycosyltransferase family 39 protein [Rhizobium sp. CC-CFT758]WJH39452.1 glycosyltransferase family 39 protein [Rhizobium sp. CC-CFT758]
MRRIRDALIARPERVLWLIAAYYLVAILVRVLRTDGLQSDEAEQLFQSQFLLWGYGRQPPFYNWLQYGVIHLIGPSIFALSLVKNGLLFLACLFYGLAARQLSERKELSAAAMLGVLALPTVTILAQRDLSHAVATLFAVSFFLYAFFGALTRPTLWRYALTGVAIGIGAISKYNFVVLPVAALLAILPEAELRRRLFDRRLFVTIVIAGLICLPHALWVLGNFQTATAGTVSALRDEATGNVVLDRLSGVLELGSAAVTGSLVLIAFLFIAFGRSLIDGWNIETVWTRVTGRMFVICLAAIGLIAVGMGATTISQKWLSPFLLLLPLYLCLKIEAAGGFARRVDGVARMAPLSLALAFGFLLYLTAGNVLAPVINRYSKDSLPSVTFIRQVLAEPRQPEGPDFIVAGSAALGGAARIAAPEAEVRLSSFVQANSITGKTGLVIWPTSDAVTLPAALAAYLQDQGVDTRDISPKVMDVPYAYSRGQKTEAFSYAWVSRPPAQD